MKTFGFFGSRIWNANCRRSRNLTPLFREPNLSLSLRYQSSVAMESKDQNVELINEAIKKLLEERKNKRGAKGERFFQGDNDVDDDVLLSRLLSQLESLKDKPREEIASCERGGGELEASGGGGEEEEIDKKEIVKELNKLRRQNTITHWLLSAMLVLTIAWQASEVTLLLKVKHGLSNPFNYFGNLISGLFSGRSEQSQQDEKRQNDAYPSLKMPELPSVELPDIGLTAEKH